MAALNFGAGATVHPSGFIVAFDRPLKRDKNKMIVFRHTACLGGNRRTIHTDGTQKENC